MDIFQPATVMKWQGFILVLGGAFFFAIFQVLSKKLINNKAPADVIGTVNFLGCGLLLLTISFLFNPPKIWSVFDIRTGIFWPLAITSVLNIFILFGHMRALKYADASLVTPIWGFGPLFGLLPSWWILGEIPSQYGYVGLVLVTIGLYVFSCSENIQEKLEEAKQKGEELRIPNWAIKDDGTLRYSAPLAVLFKNKGVQIMLVVCACGAVSVNFDKQAVVLSSYIFAPAITQLFVGLVGLFKIFKLQEWKKITNAHLTHLVVSPLVLSIIIVCFSFGFHYGLALYVSALKRTVAIFVLILSWFFLGETQVKKRWPGVSILTIGAALLSL